ncbi:hypothetical protein PMIN03_008096 [Paraphaeosphaeria minitans]
MMRPSHQSCSPSARTTIRTWLPLPSAGQSALEDEYGPTFGCVVTVALSRICVLTGTPDRPLLVFLVFYSRPPSSLFCLAHSYTTNAPHTPHTTHTQSSPLPPRLSDLLDTHKTL